ncbi:MAG: hypothetical protein ACR2IT_13155 [Pirellulales bacterium]
MTTRSRPTDSDLQQRPHHRWLQWAGCGGLVVAVTVILGSRDLAAERAARPITDPGSLWISETSLDDARRLMIVVDPSSRHAAVYHLDAATGTLVLRSTRDLTWDLMVDDFNAQEPRPSALRRMLQTGPSPSPEAIQPGVSPAR